MTKDVLITIRGVHTLDHEDNDVEMIVRGEKRKALYPL